MDAVPKQVVIKVLTVVRRALRRDAGMHHVGQPKASRGSRDGLKSLVGLEHREVNARKSARQARKNAVLESVPKCGTQRRSQGRRSWANHIKAAYGRCETEVRRAPNEKVSCPGDVELRDPRGDGIQRVLDD